MICCKIIANYCDNSGGGVSTLLEKLALCGEFLWDAGVLYFCNTGDNKVDQLYVARLLRRLGYKKFYIEEYSKDHEPRETERVCSWIYDKLIKIAYVQYENESQAVFKDISIGLDMLDDEIARLQDMKNKLLEEAEPE